MSDQKSVILDLSLKEYFVGLMSEVKAENKLSISDISFIYLSDVLEANMLLASDKSEEEDMSVFSDLMISEHYLKAIQETTDALGSYKLRSVGERALYQVGFFSEALKRKLIGLDFYIQIGTSAYSGLYQKTQSPVFEEISFKFSSYVDLFMGISQKVNLQNQADVLTLFDHLNERDSKKAEQDLINLGIVPVKSKKASNQ